MSLSTLLTKLSNARGAFVSALTSKGVTVNSSATIQSCISAVAGLDNVTLGYITSGGQFQPLAFSGTSAADSGSAVTLSCYSWNKPSISSGGVVVSSGMSFYVNSGYNYVSNTVNSFGFMYVMSGGTATNTQVDTAGFLIVSSGGTAAGVSNFFGGGFRVLDGGSAYDFNVLSMTFDFSPQTYLSGTVGGSQVVVSGNSILPMSTLSGLGVDMKSGTYAHNVTIPADDAQITFSSGASGYGIEIYGSAYIRGGIVISAVVHSGGTAEVWSGGTAGYVTVSSGGTMVIRTGAETGNITSETGAVIINS